MKNECFITIGKNIKRYLKLKNKTMQWLADKIGVQRATLSRWLNGHSQIPICDLVRISKLLDVSLDELVAGIENRKSDDVRRKANRDEKER